MRKILPHWGALLASGGCMSCQRHFNDEEMLIMPESIGKESRESTNNKISLSCVAMDEERVGCGIFNRCK